MTNFDRHNYARRGLKIGYNVVFISTAIIGLIALGPAGLFYPSALLGLVGGGIGAGIGALSPKIEISDDKYKIDMATGMPLPIKDNYRERIKGSNKENKTFWNTK